MSGFDRIISESTIRIERERVNIAKEEQNSLAQENGNLELELIKTKKELSEAKEKIEQLESRNHQQGIDPFFVDQAINNVATKVATMAREKIAKLEEELLSKPMAELAQRNKNFAEAYRIQQEMLADWMVSQKAFKELAIQFGKEKGMTKDEVVQKGLAMEEDVLNNQHEESHNTNAGQDAYIVPHIPSLKAKLKK